VNPVISVVVPVFNERENLPELRRRLVDALQRIGQTWEIVFVNDGSTDGSAALLDEAHRDDPRCKVVHLSRNFGHQPAVTAGIHHATGDAVVLIDGDLQDPPEVIPELVAAWKEGAKVVLAERRSRADRGIRGVGFRLFYPLLRRLSDLPGAPDAGIFGLMDRAVVNEFNRLPERNRFIPGLRSWLGFPTVSVFYDRQDRARGKPKQTLRRLLKYAIDGILSFSYRPLRWVTMLGLVVSTCTFVGAVAYVLYVLIARPGNVGTGFFTTIVAILFLGGVQLVSIGVVGEYVGRIYEEIKQRPLYIVKEKRGWD
jgi:dolichol-phosphate mannosyltransferase